MSEPSNVPSSRIWFQEGVDSIQKVLNSINPKDIQDTMDGKTIRDINEKVTKVVSIIRDFNKKLDNPKNKFREEERENWNTQSAEAQAKVAEIRNKILNIQIQQGVKLVSPFQKKEHKDVPPLGNTSTNTPTNLPIEEKSALSLERPPLVSIQRNPSERDVSKRSYIDSDLQEYFTDLLRNNDRTELLRILEDYLSRGRLRGDEKVYDGMSLVERFSEAAVESCDWAKQHEEERAERWSNLSQLVQILQEHGVDKEVILEELEVEIQKADMNWDSGDSLNRLSLLREQITKVLDAPKRSHETRKNLEDSTTLDPDATRLVQEYLGDIGPGNIGKADSDMQRKSDSSE